MYEYYTINHIALITGLTGRTIRNHLKTGLLEGELINGVWHFTPEQVCAFMEHPIVAASIRSRRNSLVYDFLCNEKKREGEMCTLLDSPATLHEANSVSEFFCHAINEDYSAAVQFAFSFNGTHLRVILKGGEKAVLDLMNRYQHDSCHLPTAFDR